MTFPSDYKRAVNMIAFTYHWPPRELDRMTARDLDRWFEAARNAREGKF